MRKIKNLNNYRLKIVSLHGDERVEDICGETKSDAIRKFNPLKNGHAGDRLVSCEFVGVLG